MSPDPNRPEETFDIDEPLDERGRDLWAAAQALSDETERSPAPSDYEPLAPPSQDYYYDNATNTQDLTDALRLAAEEGTIGSDLWERAMAMSQDETRRPQEHTVPDAGPARTFESPSPQPQEPPRQRSPQGAPAKELEPYDQERRGSNRKRPASAAGGDGGFPPPPAGGSGRSSADEPARRAPRPQSPRGRSMADKLRPPQDDERPLTPKERKRQAAARAKKAKEEAKAAERAKKLAAQSAKKPRRAPGATKSDARKAAQAAKAEHAARRSDKAEKLPPLKRDGKAPSAARPDRARGSAAAGAQSRPETTAEQLNNLSAAGLEKKSSRGTFKDRLNQTIAQRKSLPMGLPPAVDLLPPELQDAKRTRAAQSAGGFAVLAVAALMAGLTLIAWQDARQAQAEQQAAEQLSTDLTAAQAQFQEARELADTVEALGSAAEAATFTHISWFDIMAELRRSIPSDVRIEALSIDSASPLEPYDQREGPYVEGERAGYIEFTALSGDLPEQAVWTRGLEDVPGFDESTVVQMEGDESEGYEVLMQLQLQESLFTVPEVAE